MYAALCGIIANVAVGFVLTRLGLFGIGAVGAANAAGQAVSAAVLFGFAHGRLDGVFNGRFFVQLSKLLVGGVLVFAVCLVMSRVVGSDPYSSTFFTNVIKSAVIFAPSAAVYLAWAKLTKIKFS